MNVLVLNAGSSSLKYQLINIDTESVLAVGLCEKVGFDGSFHKYEFGDFENETAIPLPDHHAAVQAVLGVLTDGANGPIESLDDISAIGHRVVHGGEYFSASVLIDDEVLDKIKECAGLAPLHNPAAVMGIEACLDIFGSKPQVAVFDTAFHQTMPAKAYIYPVPYKYYEQYHVRRYGFHGTSHRYVADRAAAFLNRPKEELKLITCHLGNGCSISAVDGGRCVDTSMGLTPLEGLMMGTRSGSIDPAIVTFLIDKEQLSAQEVENVLNKQSGLLGVTGLSNDMRDVCDAADGGNERAQLALDIFANTVKKYIGAYAFEMNGVDAIIFTAGVGENSALIRSLVLDNLDSLGVVVDSELNAIRKGEREISAAGSQVKALVIPTNEELTIARDVKTLVS